MGCKVAAWNNTFDCLARAFRQYTAPMATSAPSPNEIERYRGAVARYIHYLVRDATEAEDLVQEALIRAHRQRDMLRDPAALESWLYRIATHVSVDRMRQRAKAAERQVDEPVEELPIADRAQPSPLTVIQQEEMSTCVQRYVGKLSDNYKAVLLLHDAEGFTANEIAHLLQLPLTTVKMRLHRARRQLQAALKDACELGRDERGVFICEPKSEDD
jgi:RNA polymerase sigma-70 factor (ECF subfamily)